MKRWWQRRSLKLRLTFWYAGATLVVLAVFGFVVYEVVEHRLIAGLDRQLRIDFDLIEAQLDTDPEGKVHWRVQGAHGDEGFARLSAWFEAWSEDRQLLLRHWPIREEQIQRSLEAPRQSTLRFTTLELEKGLNVRVMERPARISARGMIIRVLRDEGDLRRTLREIVEVFWLAAPVAVLLASVGGWFVARRSLQPLAAMAARAQQIGSESLTERLPISNPYDEIGQLAQVFNETLQRLDNFFAELKRFTADASHELRTPLMALRTVGEVALREADHPAIGSMLEEAERLQDLLDALLSLARLESGKVTVQLERLAVVPVLRDVAESLQALAAEKRQTIEVAGDELAQVTADLLLLRQALLNIVHNAVRYAPSASRIVLAAKRRNAETAIEIVDEGPGIAREHREKIFERFYRIDPARSRADGGHGLGLAIARWAIERQSGRIELESEVGRGSVFRVVLPR